MKDQKGQEARSAVKRTLTKAHRDLEKVLPKLAALEAFVEVSFLKKAILEIKKTERQI